MAPVPTSASQLENFINTCFFEYGIAAYDLELGKNLHKRRRRPRSSARTPRPWAARSASRCSRTT